MDIPQILIFIIVNLGTLALPAGYLIYRDTYHVIIGCYFMIFGTVLLMVALSGWYYLINLII
mgnify:CR=1 FL=1